MIWYLKLKLMAENFMKLCTILKLKIIYPDSGVKNISGKVTDLYKISLTIFFAKLKPE